MFCIGCCIRGKGDVGSRYGVGRLRVLFLALRRVDMIPYLTNVRRSERAIEMPGSSVCGLYLYSHLRINVGLETGVEVKHRGSDHP